MNYQQLIINNLETIVYGPEKENAVIMLHGYGANMRDLAGLANYLDRSQKFTWYFPNGPIDLAQMYPFMESRAWFPIDMAELERAMSEGRFRDFKKPAKPEFFIAKDKVKNYLQALKKKHKKIIIGGFSQGAMLASHLAMELNQDIDGLICYSGVLIDEAVFKQYQIKKSFPVFQSHGNRDEILNIEAAKDLSAALEDKGLKVEFIEFTGGHEIPQKVLDTSAQLLNSIG